MKDWVGKTRRPEVLGGLGGFAGLFDATALARMDHPVLATSTDGVGTKVAIAQAMDVHDTIGFDLVGMVVDDLVVCGAEPLFMTDYIACGQVAPERIAAIVKGIAEACVEAGCALLGGETAEHPGLLEPDEYDVAGAATGVVERDRHPRAGPGPARRRRSSRSRPPVCTPTATPWSDVFFADAGWAPGPARGRARPHPRRGAAGADPDLQPRLPGADRRVEVHAMSHVTGGGLANNLARVIPGTVTGYGSTGPPGRRPPIFELVARRRRGQRVRSRGHPQPWASGWSRCSRRGRGGRRHRTGPARAARPGSVASVAAGQRDAGGPTASGWHGEHAPRLAAAWTCSLADIG